MTAVGRRAQGWVAEWQRSHGHAPRVLHLGNIANNAYLNAKLLRAAGVEADVLCCDYYHIMGCPEWEDADLSGDYGSDDLPDFKRANLSGFRRPEWFVQGPSGLCLPYLTSVQQKAGTKTAVLRGALALSRNPRMRRTAEPFLALRRRARGVRLRRRASAGLQGDVLMSRAKALSEAFARVFPQRVDRPSAEGLLPLVAAYMPFQAILPAYDVIHAYATQGLLPLVANRPYVVYEHGTIRGLPFEAEPVWQLCALSYRCAARVFITNADAVHAIRRLGLERITFVPHPVNEEHLAEDDQSRSIQRQLRQEFDSDFVVFHPARQDWSPVKDPVWEKGNDVFIRGFARFVREVNPRAAAVFVHWGRSIAATERLLMELGIAGRVRWIAPLPNRSMVRWICAADVVADQFLVGAFGGITPKALACGRTVLLKLDEEAHRWCFPEMPPVLNAPDEEAVFEQLRRVYLQPQLRRTLERDGPAWYRRYHSNDVVRDRLLDVYQAVLAEGAPSRTADSYA